MKTYIKLLHDKGRLDLENISEITSNRIQTLIFTTFDIYFNIVDINRYLKEETELIEIGENFFVNKYILKERLKDVDESQYKTKLENEYFLSLSEIELTKFKYFFNKKFDEKYHSNKEYCVEDYSIKTYEEILDFGLKNSYVLGLWLNSVDYSSTDFYDVEELIYDLVERKIKII